MVARTAAGEAALGRPELFQQLGIDASEVPEHEGPIAGIALDGRFLGWLLLADSVRAEAPRPWPICANWVWAGNCC